MRIRLNCNSLEGNDYLFEDHLFQSFLRLSARDIPSPPSLHLPNDLLVCLIHLFDVDAGEVDLGGAFGGVP